VFLPPPLPSRRCTPNCRSVETATSSRFTQTPAKTRTKIQNNDKNKKPTTKRQCQTRSLDGGTNRIQRMIDLETFNRPGSDVFVYILATRAGGLGVNLQTADTCVLYDR